MINAARDLADRADAAALAEKVQGGPRLDSAEHAGFLAEVEALRVELAEAAEFRPGRAVAAAHAAIRARIPFRSEEHTSELQSLMRNSYAVFCLKKKM